MKAATAAEARAPPAAVGCCEFGCDFVGAPPRAGAADANPSFAVIPPSRRAHRSRHHDDSAVLIGRRRRAARRFARRAGLGSVLGWVLLLLLLLLLTAAAVVPAPVKPRYPLVGAFQLPLNLPTRRGRDQGRHTRKPPSVEFHGPTLRRPARCRRTALDSSSSSSSSSAPSSSSGPTSVSERAPGSSSPPPPLSSPPWFPRAAVADALGTEGEGDEHQELPSAQAIERQAVDLAALLIRKRLLLPPPPPPSLSDGAESQGGGRSPEPPQPQQPRKGRGCTVPHLVRGRFLDLAARPDGERALEGLFADVYLSSSHSLSAGASHAPTGNGDEPKGGGAIVLPGPLLHQRAVLLGAVMAVQSLCVMGLCVGLRGPPELLRRLASHLDARRDPGLVRRDVVAWDGDSVRRLKYRGTTTTASASASSAPGESGDGGSVRAPALALLLALKRKRTPAGAFELLVRLGAWTEHEDLALLRSGFPLRFTDAEWRSAAAAAAAAAAASQPPPGRADVDSLLGIRRDLRGLKVYTVDSASTSEVDDGISVEMVRNETTGLERPRYWIHIADAERWADAEVASLARKRVTSLYIPTGSYPMFPPPVGADLMSLRPGRDACALSLGVELNGDGSVDAESIVVTPSLVRVAYRLTYDEVDEMLEEGAGYSEEWQLGALLGGAILRREFRMRAGSMESLVPNPVPGASVAVFPDRAAPGGIGISLAVQVSHNAGRNRTASAEAGAASQELSEPAPVSSAYLLVTELMILAGEAIAQWKCRRDRREADSAGANGSLPPVNKVRLPFRTQPPPDFKSRARERRVMLDLLESDLGGGYCHAWYARRFLQSVKVSELPGPHSGLGLACYVQWSSPIRRFSDFQVHVVVKRYLRRQRLYEMLQRRQELPAGVDLHADLGFPAGSAIRDGGVWYNGTIPSADELDRDVDFFEGGGLIGAARNLQRLSQQYWLYEHVRRHAEEDPDRLYSAIVLGCVDPERQQYAIYVEALGLEHRYTTPGRDRLEVGARLQLRVDSVLPRVGTLTFVHAA